MQERAVEVSQTGASRVAKVAEVETQDGFEDQNPATRSLVAEVRREFDAMVSNIANDVLELLKDAK